MKQNWAERLRASMHHQAESLGNLLVEAFHYLALFAIGATVFWAAGVAFLGMVNKGHASIDDILLLFIYLELGAMVGIYFKTNHTYLTHATVSNGISIQQTETSHEWSVRV
ncbi:TPA: phosphate-starvation-inducible E [Pseudomonas aeruginosa]|nr:phosphate-starvation-inducible E [Pseudomonas aeruginosa]KQJ70904.1 phosphate-starvation-inducible E [Pseudomonas aeruginosa]MCO4040683.1 phosphate-starvation-inducible E [Pseudomonas aeruginosa]MUI99313.1 phosphate-starvation-inducible E [Pseudomonas aeruginosa]RPT98056.1 phosphate-starvation-inducible E [Pseudomonas aeruginosa]